MRAQQWQLDDYADYKSESRACGYEVMSFKEWMGEISAHEAAQDRLYDEMDSGDDD
jgi:hypothetical protein